MTKEIIREDLIQVKLLLKEVVGSDTYKKIARMGGLTNHTYHVIMEDDEQYVVRIPGEGTEELIVRKDEMISTKLACDLGIDAKLLYFSENGAKVTNYITDAVTMSSSSLKEPGQIVQIAEVLKKLHTCGVDTKVPFEVFDMAEGYEKIIFEKQVPMFSDYQEMKAEVMRIKQEVDEVLPSEKVPCHNDPLCENWVVGNGQMYLIDWEYAGMNDGMWDLADVSIEACYDKACDLQLLRAYMGKEPDTLEWKHFLANKIYVDYLWTLWAKARVPYDGQPMEDWALERYTRLKSFIKEYKEI